MSVLNVPAGALLVIGGLNWGLVAIAKVDLVAELVGLGFGETNAASRVVCGLVGLAAIYAIGAVASARRRVLSAPESSH